MAIPPQRRPEPDDDPAPEHPSWCHPADCRADDGGPHRSRTYRIRTLHKCQVSVHLYQQPGDHPPRVRKIITCWGATVELDLAPTQAGQLAEVLDEMARQVGI